MIENAIINVIIKTDSNAIKKNLSAIVSYILTSLSFVVRIDKNENILLVIKKIQATPVNSSIFVSWSYFDILSDVKTTKQNPNRFEDVFKICCELLFAITKTLKAITPSSITSSVMDFVCRQVYNF